jgi:hypothetical protein
MVIGIDYSAYCCDDNPAGNVRSGNVYADDVYAFAMETADSARMNDDSNMPSRDTASDVGGTDTRSVVPSRRQLLMGGAVAASAIVSIRPALAATAASVLNCRIPVPDPPHASQYIAADGSLVATGTDGAVAGPGRPFTGEEVKAALRGRSLPGTSYEQNQAYLNYIRRLQMGTSGFTCYHSLQMPR